MGTAEQQQQQHQAQGQQQRHDIHTMSGPMPEKECRAAPKTTGTVTGMLGAPRRTCIAQLSITTQRRTPSVLLHCLHMLTLPCRHNQLPPAVALKHPGRQCKDRLMWNNRGGAASVYNSATASDCQADSQGCPPKCKQECPPSAGSPHSTAVTAGSCTVNPQTTCTHSRRMAEPASVAPSAASMRLQFDAAATAAHALVGTDPHSRHHTLSARGL